MENIERAIRAALNRGDADERDFREKVYRSAFAALDRTLQANAALSEDDRQRRRAALKATIKNIESDYLPALAPEEARPAAAAPQNDVPEPESELRRAELSFPAPPTAPEPERWDEAPVAPAAERDEIRVHEARRRSRLWPLVAFLILVAVVLGAAVWAYDSGYFGAARVVPAADDSQEESPPEPASPETPAPEAAAGEDWITLFTPADLSLVDARGGATAEVMEADGEAFLRLRSGDAGASAGFAVGQGILERIAGRSAVFSIVAAASEDDGETQISVDCALAELGECGRRRFLVGINREEFLFNLPLPNVRPGGGGTITINSDIEQLGRSVDIFSIRVAPAE